MIDKNKIELMMPAGNLDILKTAVMYGADSVYTGTPDLSLRTQSQFGLDEVEEGAKFLREHGKKLYMAVNLFTQNRDIEKLPYYAKALRHIKPDGLIIADPAVFDFFKREVPELNLHISTQANVCSWFTVDYWKNQGASLCVMAREVSFADLKEIRNKCPDIKLETFVHGSICMAYSGRCLMSSYMSGRSANSGNCAHSCRWEYRMHIRLKDGSIKEIEVNDSNRKLFEFLLEEGVRPGQLMAIEEDDLGSYFFNAKDLCLLPKLPEYIDLGIDVLKVEGRHKTAFYVGSVARAYRNAIDDYYADKESWHPQKYVDELFSIQSRGLSLGFHEGTPESESFNYKRTSSLSDVVFAGFVREYIDEEMIFELKGRLHSGSIIEFLIPSSSTMKTIRLRLYEFKDAQSGEIKQTVATGKPGFAIAIPISAFHAEDAVNLRELIPPLTIARTEQDLSLKDTAWLQMDRASFKYQYKTGTDKEINALKNKIQLLSKDDMQGFKDVKPKARIGLDSCCGKACNGCHMFWNHPRFAKEREEYYKNRYYK